MINLTDSLPDIEGVSPFILAKISANFSAYGSKYNFLDFWQQKCESRVTALISKQDDIIFITANSDADFEEIKEFLSVIGYGGLQTDKFTAERLGLDGKKYTLLQLINPAKPDGIVQVSPPLKDIYDILFEEENEDIKKPDFKGWYGDFSHRLRHLTATAVILEKCSVGVASHITKDAAVISGVATKKDFRNRGLGEKTLQQLIKKLPQNIYTATANSVKFYQNLGFNVVGEIIII